MNKKLADLHMHSSFSDGKLTPHDLANLVYRSGLRAFALTDHDTLKGLPEAKAAALGLGVEFVPGVEISAGHDEREVHILGYYPQDLELLDRLLDEMRLDRYDRMEKMVRRLISEGFKIEMNEVLQEAGNAAPGRLHLARLLVRKKYVVNIDQAFNLYLARGKAGYVKRSLPASEKVIKLLHECGAVPVLAHPKSEGKEDPQELKNYGLQGIEVYHPDHSKSLVIYYRELAEKLDLAVTGGSDYHGDHEGSRGNIKKYAIDYGHLNQLKKAVRTWK